MKEKKEQSKQQKANKNLSLELLENYRGALMTVNEFFKSVKNRKFNEDNVDESLKLVQGILSSSANLGKAFESLNILEKKVEQDEEIKSKVRGDKKLSMLETGDI